MFEIGDKVIDSQINKIGTIISIVKTDTYPIIVDFSNTTCSYTSTGFYNAQIHKRHIKKVEDITGTVKVSPTHIYISFSHSTFLLPIALTSFKIVNDILTATYNEKEYTVYTDNIDKVVEHLLNPTKKESL